MEEVTLYQYWTKREDGVKKQSNTWQLVRVGILIIILITMWLKIDFIIGPQTWVGTQLVSGYP